MIRSLLHPPIITLTNFELNLLQVEMQVWLDYHLQKRRFVSIFFVPHSRPKFGMLPVWQSHLCLHQWEWTFLHDSNPWQEHMSVHARFCSAQTQDFPHCDFPLHEHTRSRRNSADMFPSKRSCFP
jgi:hypothetical protein